MFLAFLGVAATRLAAWFRDILKGVFGLPRPYRRFAYPSTLDNRSIRLVQVLPRRAPASWFACPELLVRAVALEGAQNETPGYIALSYTWGAPKDGLPGYSKREGKLSSLTARNLRFLRICTTSSSKPGRRSREACQTHISGSTPSVSIRKISASGQVRST